MSTGQKRFYLGSNWKMNKTIREMEEYLPQFAAFAAQYPGTQFFAIPPYTHLQQANELLKGTSVKLGAQNAHWLPCGPYTGEISPDWLKDFGVEIVELGHSERRAYYNENDWDLNKKVQAAQIRGLTALLCIGENRQEKDFGVTEEVLRKQLKIALKDNKARNLWVAYEPVWAIGEGGTPAEPGYVEQIHGMIRRALWEMFGVGGIDIPLLYGGSVNPSNCAALADLDNVNGLFIGRSAWDIRQFEQIVGTLDKLKKL